MQRRAASLAAIAVFGFAAASCSNDSDSKEGLPVDDTTTTEATTATTTATTAKPAGPASSPEAAAKGLLAAWEAGDRDGASRFARPAAINEIFSHPNTGDVEYADQGCQPQGGQFRCSWTYPGGALHMTVEGVLGTSGFVVDIVSYTAD
ncbi:MAG: hypothetical protein Q8K63_00230 [Acidimicrobiales bacterium]|nr:hypothetical protein [Acidimicrobiales bacterium]